MKTQIEIVQAITTEQMDQARELFQGLSADLGVDFCFQGFEVELAGLPGAYAPPRGRLLLTRVDGQAVGCVALRPLDERTCEMKRMFVRPSHRGQGIGRRLAEQIVNEARQIGYATMKLDTLLRLESAIQIYRSLGFVECPPYNQSPIPETAYFELNLSASNTMNHS